MKRVTFFVYGVVCHLMFLAVYAYLAGFVGNYFVPKSIDAPPADSTGLAIVINVALLLAFGVQHSVMARPAFKAVWTRWVPQPIERSTYVLASNLILIFLMWLWRPIDTVVWNVSDGWGWYVLTGLFVVGWLMVPTVSLMINHFDLFGTRQVWLHLHGKEYTPLAFRTPMLYGVVRHPLYIGWMLAFWATPKMTVGHLLFAGVLSAYMVLASKVEERDLVHYFGDVYKSYQRKVPAFVPLPKRGAQTVDELKTA